MKKVIVQKAPRGADGQFILRDHEVAECACSADHHEQAAKQHAQAAEYWEDQGRHDLANEHRVAADLHTNAAAHMRSGSVGGQVWNEKARKASTAMRRRDRGLVGAQEVVLPNGGVGDFHS